MSKAALTPPPTKGSPRPSRPNVDRPTVPMSRNAIALLTIINAGPGSCWAAMSMILPVGETMPALRMMSSASAPTSARRTAVRMCCCERSYPRSAAIAAVIRVATK